MPIVYQTSDNFKILEDACLCFGVFDGVHEGHKYEINQCIEEAKLNDKKSVCVTFDIDPDELFVSDFLKLLDNDKRISKINDCGVDVVYVIDFKSIMHMDAVEFLDYFFANNVPSSIHVGKGFRFGSKQSGDVGLLKEWGNTHGMKVHVHDLLKKNGHVISSTYLRDEIKKQHKEEL